MHFMNPVPIMKLVEVIRGYDTSDETTATVVALSQQLGKSPGRSQRLPGLCGEPDFDAHDQRGHLQLA